jgi:dTDP-4-dehydrorhamnose reductase
LRVLVLGASGMLGNVVFRVMREDAELEVFGTVRSKSAPNLFSAELEKNIITNCDVNNYDALVELFVKHQPELVVNCIGLIKQLTDTDDPLITLPINAMLPHRLAHLCKLIDARLIHISTDCVFSGSKGNYKETDISDARDIYGKSKYLGEVSYPNCTTLRTSIIGHELGSSNGLIDWFLSQENSCRGFRRAIFSGLPTIVLAKVIRDFVLPEKDLIGVYHVAAKPISKYDLLKMVADIYGKKIDVIPDDELKIDRSLNAERFNLLTGYAPPDWPELIKAMYSYQ